MRTNWLTHCKVIFSLALPLFLAGSAPVWQWPMGQDGDLVRGITSTFGEPRGDHFHNGVDLAGMGRPVQAVAAGKILYSREESDHPFRPMEGPGNFLLIRHENTVSGYYHLRNIVQRAGSVGPSTIVAYSGNSGYSGGAHLHFFLLEGNDYLNPLQLLPAAQDLVPPQGGNLSIITPAARTVIQPDKPATVRLTQKFPVVVEVPDPGQEKNTRRGIYKLNYQLGSGPVESRVFDRMQFKDERWLIGGLPFEKVFHSGQYLLDIAFENGINTLKIQAADFAGNQVDFDYRIQVNREY